MKTQNLSFAELIQLAFIASAFALSLMSCSKENIQPTTFKVSMNREGASQIVSPEPAPATPRPRISIHMLPKNTTFNKNPEAMSVILPKEGDPAPYSLANVKDRNADFLGNQVTLKMTNYLSTGKHIVQDNDFTPTYRPASMPVSVAK